jgi:hypothetical protein
MKDCRRDFIKKTMAASAAVSIGGILPGLTAKSYATIMGANERIKVGVMGVHARGLALAQNYASQKNCEVQNFFDGIRKDAPLNAEIEKAYRSTLLAQLGNIAVRAGNVSFKTDPENGHILQNEEAGKYWQRKYQPGWEPVV